MAGITAVEGKATAKKGPKKLAHIEIHPRMGGGVRVRHVYEGYEHEPRHYDFKEDEGHRAMGHIARHAGLPHGEAGREEAPGDSGAEREPEDDDEDRE